MASNWVGEWEQRKWKGQTANGTQHETIIDVHLECAWLFYDATDTNCLMIRNDSKRELGECN